MNLKRITPTIRRYLAAVVFLLLANIIFLWPGLQSDYPKTGMHAQEDIIAPYTFPIPKDTITLKLEQAIAKSQVPVVLDQVFSNAHTQPLLLPLEAKQVLESRAGPQIRNRAQAVVKKIEEQGYWPEKFGDNRLVTIRTGETEFQELSENIIGKAEADSIIRHEAQKLYPENRRLQTAFYYTAFSLLKPTLSYNHYETDARRNATAQAVDRNRGYVLKGELLVRAKEKVTPEVEEKLKALAITKPKKNPFMNLFGTTLILILALGLGSLYFVYQKVRVWQDELSLYLILSLAIFTFVLSRALGLISYYLTPLGMAAILLTLLLDLEVATIFTIIASLCLGFMARADFSLSLYLFAGAMLGSFIAPRIRRRSKFYYGALAIATGNIIALLVMALSHQNFGLDTLKLVGFALLNGLIAATGVILLLPVFERLFGFATTLTLNDLVDLNRPLLQRMVLEAPGTYHHSIIVANLAEACARAIGANPVLTRAGGYLHDIGKLKKPDYFIENLSGKRNPHDRLTPKMSSLIISAHVKDGLELARRERLPRPVQEIIAQHHGTTLMEPFYEKAERLKTGTTAYEFRYPGPKPQSKEAALVMIADTVEATARAERRISASRLKKVIKETTEERYIDGQFDNCDLTRKELEKIAEVLYPVLVGIFHPRVSYPKDENRGLHTQNSLPR